MRFKPTKREQMQANLATHQLYASAFGKPVMAGVAEAVTPVQERAKAGSDGREIEAPIKAAIEQLLAVHPKVLIAVRMNSGTAWREIPGDRPAPVVFHKWLRSPEKMRFVDFIGWTTDFRPWCIEAKRADWQWGKSYGPTRARELAQREYIEFVRNAGGLAGFATSVDMAMRILNGN